MSPHTDASCFRLTALRRQDQHLVTVVDRGAATGTARRCQERGDAVTERRATGDQRHLQRTRVGRRSASRRAEPRRGGSGVVGLTLPRMHVTEISSTSVSEVSTWREVETGPREATDLPGPLVINASPCFGRQVVLSDPELSTRVPRQASSRPPDPRHRTPGEGNHGPNGTYRYSFGRHESMTLEQNMKGLL